MSTDQLTYSGTLVVRSCWCGLRHGVPSELDYVFRAGNVEKIYCPLGHSGYLKVPDRHAVIRERAITDQLDAAERSRIALKGHLTRLRNRIAAGVCPWCKRSFAQVERHVRSKHPEHVEQMTEAMDP